jgi:hypothetical protein
MPLTRMMTLNGGERLEIPLCFRLSQGEYEFMAGYGGGVHAGRALASNLAAFDVDGERERSWGAVIRVYSLSKIVFCRFIEKRYPVGRRSKWVPALRRFRN